MNVLDRYVDEAMKTIMRMDPTLDKKHVKKLIQSAVKRTLKDPTVNWDNNVTGENHDMTLVGLCDYLDERKPVISGNATFYKQPSELMSPCSEMLRSLKKGRKAVKKEMFKCKPGSDEYAMLDLDQQNKKVIMNAEYGGSGTPTAAFYTKYSPAATTMMAQSIITTAAAFFEGFVGDNMMFWSVNECYDWMNKVCEKTDKIPKWIYRPSVDEVLHRITHKFREIGLNDIKYLKKYLQGCTSDELVYIYFANNMHEFIYRHSPIQELLAKILDTLPKYEASETTVPEEFAHQFDNIDSYNKWVSKVMFMDPYTIPDDIVEILRTYIDYMMQFVFVEYLTPDSIVKLNAKKRNTVLLVDTDSNIVNADMFARFVQDEIFPGWTFGRKPMYNDMILVNVLCATISTGIAKILDYYGRCHNMDEESRAELSMKNEFLFKTLFLTKKKKRYAASIMLREGNIMLPLKAEIKGLDFMKAGVSDEVTAKFTNVIKDHIIFSDDVNLHEMMRDLKQFEKEIYMSLIHGETSYLKPQSYKSEASYAKIKDKQGNVIGTKAWSLPVYRGVAVWNAIVDVTGDTNKIYSFDRVKLINLVVTGPGDMDVIKDKFPMEYNAVIKNVFGNDDPHIREAGMKVICIPGTMPETPKWIIPLIDTEAMISSVMSSFKSVLDSFDTENISYKTPNGKANTTSCLISL